MTVSGEKVQGLRSATYVVYIVSAAAFAAIGLWFFAATLAAVVLVLAVVQLRRSLAVASARLAGMDALLERADDVLESRVPVSR